MSDRCIDIERFTGDALLFFRREKFDGAHVVQTVGEFYDDDAHVMHHGQEHFANVFRLPRFRREHIEAANLGDAFDKLGGLLAKSFLNSCDRKFGVFDDVVENGGGEGGGIHLHVGENVRNFKQMRHVRIAGAAELIAVALCGDFVGAADYPGVFRRPVFAELGQKLLKAGVQQALGALAMEVDR